jgi:hypothetical protein
MSFCHITYFITTTSSHCHRSVCHTLTDGSVTDRLPLHAGKYVQRVNVNYFRGSVCGLVESRPGWPKAAGKPVVMQSRLK